MLPPSKWGPGPWERETNEHQWIDPETGFICRVLRNKMTGTWCGYVGVEEGHPAYEKGYDEVDVAVHGGLSYGDFWKGDRSGPWYLGFDCAHAGDLMPAFPQLGGSYKAAPFVVEECRVLAMQLAAMTPEYDPYDVVEDLPL